ncbi:hypothetical protein AYK20_03150 [Thermoplasmatales archaeon SG8-52-1]|nr:MAG: hypothetical protein AYK20_03150 [Thermoplasmatales archaeon SG8-52-1]
MNKKFLVIAIVFLFLTLLFSGCEENNRKIGGQIIGDLDKVELVSYSIKTYNRDNEIIGDGFVHNGNEYLYKLNGTVKNIIGGLLNRVYIGYRFYDKYNNFIHSKIFLIAKLEYNNTKDFNVNYVSTEPGFYNVEKVDFYFFVIVEG